MKVRVLIADDEEHCRRQLSRLLRMEEQAEIVAECANGLEALDALEETRPDLAFLDIRMPELDGFAVLEAMEGSRTPAIVFVSAFDSFAARAFDTDVVDYLLKPFDRERFQRAFNRAVTNLRNDPDANRAVIQHMLETAMAGENAPRRFTIKTDGRYLVIDPSEVDWISAADNYSELHVGKKTHLLRSTMGAMAERLKGQEFVQVSRSALVNCRRVTQIQPKAHGDALITVMNGEAVHATRGYRDQWRQLVEGSI
jgi:two-component system, LytTR family, response regulator